MTRAARGGVLCLLLAAGALPPAPAHAFASELYSSMSYLGLSIEAPAGIGVDWTLPWYGQLDAEAVDSTPDARVAGLKPEGNTLDVAVQAPTPLALAIADIVVVDGDAIGEAGAGLEGFADAQAGLDPGDGYAYAYAGSYFENRFQVAGETSGEAALLRLSLTWSGEFGVATGAGTAGWEMLSSVFLQLYDLSADAVLADDAQLLLEGGTGATALTWQGDGTLSVEYGLLPGREYLLLGAADVAVFVTTPAPWGLLLAGVAGLRLSRRARTHARRPS